jgi:hypothetical protein
VTCSTRMEIWNACKNVHVEMYLKKIWREGVEWIDLAHIQDP